MLISKIFYAMWIGLFILLGLAGLGVVGMIAYPLIQAVRNRYAKLERVSARVARKHTREMDMSIQLGGHGITDRLGIVSNGGKNMWNKSLRNPYRNIRELDAGSWTIYIISFAFDDKEMEFSVPADTYAEIEEGEEGFLSFQGDKFKFFVH